MSSINFCLPFDIRVEILVRLPAESVIRFRAVSKGWLAVIDDPCFVRAHTNNLQRQQLSSSNVIIRKITNHISAVHYSLDLEALISCNKGHHAITAVPLDHHAISDEFSSCNGLVLTVKYTEALLTVWNPLTHEQLDLPPPAPGFQMYSLWAFGLGYDGTTDDYKVVAILSARETHVYSLKQDSWSTTTNFPCDVDTWGPHGPQVVFVCGALNWLSKGKRGAYDDDMIEYDVKIVALDLGTEKYSLLQMTHLKTSRLNDILLIVLGGRLALCDYRNETHLDVWVMKVFRDEDSWFKLFSIERSEQAVWSGYLRPLAFTMNEKLVFLQADKRFFLFDVETKSLKWVEIKGSVIKKGSYLSPQQMFVGTIFRLHANCGGGGGGGRVRTSYTNNKKNRKKKKASDAELLFCIRDANGMYNYVSCSERGCHLSSENEELT